MLTFVGLGLYDERSITLQGRDALQAADRVFAERYTSRLVGASLEDVEAAHDVEIELRTREGVEQDPEPILTAAENGDAVFCTAGDPMISTTHVDLRLRAHERGIDTRIVHGTTAAAAASSLTGLQNYRFGKATTLPFESSHGGEGVPASVIETIEDNRERGLHTLVFLDIKVDDDREDYMTGGEAASLLAADWNETAPAVVVARAGSPEPLVRGDRLEELAGTDFGDPLHLLVIPGELHYLERDALVELAGLPAEAAERLLV
ncbi:diphthine synthase [Halapricum desulfuricans]|uniref:Diphthine synthase n=1 Tax=Halapricum desulfuricans TaxID=2841257 RepID=A0A897N055_9EURY|nr:diphthine synthase [Halapricum desulfuricans]QSG05901.1 Diphthamide biosynthesis methyltransferase [Halapricum desulfuricans]